MRKMKDSGIEWIGEIPEDWEVKKIKNIASNKGEKNRPDEQVLSLYRELGIVIKAERDDNFNVTSENTDNYKFVDRNDLVVNKMKAWQGSIAVSKYVGIVSPAYYVFAFTRKDIYPFYIHYLLRSSVYLPEYRRLSGGIRPGQWDLSNENFKNVNIVVPSNDEQTAIANYLDDKCSKIDATIEREKQHIEKLKEYRQAVITEAVTKGLDPTVPMKDSGIEWIEKVPEGWVLTKIKYIAEIMRGKFNHRPRNDPRYYDGEHPFVQTGDIARSTKFITEYSQTLNELGYSVSKEFPIGCIVMTIAANVGDVAVLKFNACFPDSIVGFVPSRKINWNYLYYTLKSMKAQLLKNAIMSTQMNLNIEIIKEEFITLPRLKEQTSIANYLDRKTAQINNAISKKQTLIEKLTEYKKSLIYEAVTGKVEIL